MRKFDLRVSLATLIFVMLISTALLIHASWNYTARKNVGDVVEQLNRQIVDSVQREFFSANYNIAWSTQEVMRSLLSQDRALLHDDKKRQTLLLSLLESQPGLSWIGIGLANGDFIAAHHYNKGRVDIESISWNTARGRQTVTPQGEDANAPQGENAIAPIVRETSFRATDQAWYQNALQHGDVADMVTPVMPDNVMKALCFSAPLTIDGVDVGVVLVAIELDKLGQFLDGLQAGKSGTVIIVSQEGEVIASAENAAGSSTTTGDLLQILKMQIGRGDIDLKTLSDPRAFVLTPDGRHEQYFINFSSLSFEGWIIATIIPGNDFLAAIDRNSVRLLYVLAAVTALMVLLAVTLVDRLIALPLIRVTRQLSYIQSFDLGGVHRIQSPLRELDDLSSALVRMSRGLASFQKYMPTELVRTLVSRGIEAQPGGSQENLTVLFSDIAGFTGLSEALGDEIVPLLTDYLNLATGAILASRGTIDKFIGDAVMAFWGAPIPNQQHAIDGCAAALEFQAKLAAQRPIWQDADRPPVHTRIGVNSGRMLVGNIGSNERLNYTVIGDAVNISARLEALNKIYGTEILIGEDTRKEAGDAIIVRRLDQVSVYGRIQGVTIYELLAMAATGAGTPTWVASYEAGLDCYGRQDWQAAIGHFEQTIALRGEDRPSRLMIRRCQKYLGQPPGPDWTAVTQMDSKD